MLPIPVVKDVRPRKQGTVITMIGALTVSGLTRARTKTALDNAIAMAMALITLVDTKAWFRHCGFNQAT